MFHVVHNDVNEAMSFQAFQDLFELKSMMRLFNLQELHQIIVLSCSPMQDYKSKLNQASKINTEVFIQFQDRSSPCCSSKLNGSTHGFELERGQTER